jgi:hypothetical protein
VGPTNPAKLQRELKTLDARRDRIIGELAAVQHQVLQKREALAQNNARGRGRQAFLIRPSPEATP